MVERTPYLIPDRRQACRECKEYLDAHGVECHGCPLNPNGPGWPDSE